MPLPPPANYGIGLPDIPDPSAALQKNLEYAGGLLGLQQKAILAPLQQEQAQLQLDQERQQVAQQQALRAQLAAYSQNPTHDGALQIMAAHPEIAEKYKPVMEGADKKEKDAFVSQAAPIYSALVGGAPDIAIRKAEESATAYDNSNMPEKAAGLRKIISDIKTNPAVARLSLVAPLQAAMTPEAFANIGKSALFEQERAKAIADAASAHSDSIKKASDAKYADPKNAAEIGSSLASAASARASAASSRDAIKDRAAGRALDEKKFGLEKDLKGAEIAKIQNEIGKLPAEAEKAATEALPAIQKAREVADKAGALATHYEKLGQGFGTSGATARAIEYAKALTGNEDERSAKIQEYKQLLNDETLQKLAGVRITENEIKMVKQGFADPTANPKIVAPALRKLEELANLKADISRATVKWVSTNRSMGAATREFTINGRPVKIGDTLDDVLTAMAPKPAAAPASATSSEPSWIKRYK